MVSAPEVRRIWAGSLTTPKLSSHLPWDLIYFMASGFTGEPTPPVIGNGAPVRRNSPVCGAILGEGLQVEDLTGEQTRINDENEVEGLEHVRRLIR